MNKDELLRPRYKVMADFPFNEIFNVGSILSFFKTTKDGKDEYWYHHDVKHNNFQSTWFDGFPHLFKPLQWWEDRDINDMPEYLKDNGDAEIFKVREWVDNSMGVIWLNKNKKMNHTGFHQANAEHFTPATEAEYLDYLTQQNNNERR